MTTGKAIEQMKNITNGINVDQVMGLISAIESDTGYARFQFRAANRWIDGGQTQSRIKEFYAGNAEDTTRKQSFALDSDEPMIAAGKDSAPNAMEYVLHALASCLTTSLIYHAAVRGIEVESVESSLSGNMDVRGLLGMADDVRKGFSKVTVNMRVKSEASAEELSGLAMFSPVHDIISHSLPVEFILTTY